MSRSDLPRRILLTCITLLPWRSLGARIFLTRRGRGMARLEAGLVLELADEREWDDWLAANHASAREAWLRLAKKASDGVTITRAAALKTALCYGWIDGQAARQDDDYWLQRFTPRTRRSRWSRINCDAVEALIRGG